MRINQQRGGATERVQNTEDNMTVRSGKLTTVTTCLLLLLIYWIPFSSTSAITINMVFDPASVSPAFDPGGTLLQGMANNAAQIWEDIFEEADTVTINYRYNSIGGLANGTATTVVGGQPTVGSINIDSDNVRTWYFDPTPLDNSEYTMTQRLYRDLTAAQQTAWYDSTPPDLLEASYRGQATATAPANAQTGFDMFSTLVHEIGHVLGLSHTNMANAETVGEGDFDFDVNAVLAGGNFFEIEAAGTNPAVVNQWAHIAAQSLMCNGCAATGLRRLPSATDVFAIQSAAGWNVTGIDLSRQDFLTGTDWNTAGNWEGNQVPLGADDAFVRTANRTANLSGGANVRNLTVSETGNVNTQGFELDVAQTLTVADLDSDLLIGNGGEAEATTLNVINNAEVRPETGSLIDVNRFDISDNSLLVGAGEVNVQTELENDGTITASGGTLTLTTSNAGGVFDLDGFFSSGGGLIAIFTEPGRVNATGGDIVVDGQLTDGFNGTMTVSSTRAITFQDDWELSAFSLFAPSTGVLNLTEGTVAGPGKMTAQGILNVSTGTGNGISYINSPVDFGSQVIVNVNAGAELEVNGAATVDGGTYNVDDDGLLDFDSTLSIGSATFSDVGVAGTAGVRFDGITTYSGGTINATVPLHQQGDLAVNGATVVNGTIVNLDGGGSTTVTLNDDLTINADSLDSFNNTFDGTLNINNPGRLTVSTTEGSWTMNGEMNLNQNGHANRFLVLGDDINISGQVTVTDAAAIGAAAHISGTVTLGDASYFMQLGGSNNTLSGGTIVGPGRLAAVGNTSDNSLTGYGTISADIEFSGSNTDLLADGGTLSVSGEILDVDDIGTANGTGTLDVVSAWNTSVASELRLNGGEVTGGGITNDGTTIGYGLVTSSSFVNNSTLTADGGTLTLDTGSFPDLDGSSETGTINALDGSVEVLTPVGGNFGFNGTLNVGVGQMFYSSTRGLTNSGVVNLTNGTVAATDFSQDAQLNVSAGGPSRLEAAGIDFEWGSTSTVEDDLELMGSTDIYAGAVFGGSGQLVVPAGAVLHLKDGSFVGVGIENNGQVVVGSSPGLAVVGGNYSQSGGSLLEMEIEGTTAGTEYDVLDVNGSAALAGTLDVTLVDLGGGLFAPSSGDRFDILTAAGGIVGTFDSENLPASYAWDVDYNATTLSLEVLALLGDMDGNNNLTSADMPLFIQAIVARATYDLTYAFVNADVAGDIDGSGIFDLGDLGLFSGLFGGPASAEAVPEPSAWVLTLLVLAAAVGAAQRRSN